MKRLILVFVIGLMTFFSIYADSNSLSTGLVAYYPFNGNANDESGNGNNGTVNGATLTSDRFGNVGKAYSFNGEDNNIITPVANGFSSEITLCAWVRLNGLQNNENAIIGSRIGSGSINAIGVSGDGLYFHLVGDGNISINHQINVDDNWHFIVGTYSDGKQLLYYDNQLISESNRIINLTVNSPFIIGQDNEVGLKRFFNGSIDEVRIYNRALSSDEITQLYNSEKPATDLTTGLVAYYPFNGNANDESGNGNNGTVNGATLTTDRFGNVGKAYSFDGVNNRVELPLNLNSKINGLRYFSISGWCNIPQNGGGGIFSNWKAFPLTDPFGINISIDKNKLCAGNCAGTGNVSNESIITSKWTHFSVVFNGDLMENRDKLKLFIDGKQIITTTGNNVYSSFPIADNLGQDATNTVIGSWISQYGWYGNYNGLLDDIRIYNRALSSDEVTQLYNSEKPATDLTTGLVAYYPFNGNANDESGNGNNGTVNGATLTTDRFGNEGKAYSFDGTNNSILIKDFTDNLQELTISAWIFTNEISKNRYYEIIRGNAFLLSFQEYGTQLTLGLSGDISIESNTQIDSTLISNRIWHHIVGMHKNNSLSIYIDGNLIGSTPITSNKSIGNYDLYIGAWGGSSEFFNGNIDDIRIYNRALSAEEIKYLYSGQQTIKLDAPTDIQYRTTKISNSTNTKTTLIWKSVTGAKIYEVYKDGILLGKTFSTIFYDENPEGNYKYQIASVNASGKSPLSLPCNVSVSGTNTVAGYGSLAIYITDANKQKVENALIQFTDGSTAQTLKTGFVLLKNIPYGTTKEISRIVKSGWDFTAINGNSFACSKSKPSMVLKYTATPTPENEPTMETFNPQYSSELVIVSDGDITLPTFTKGQDFTLDIKIASTSQYWWNGNIRLKAVRKGVEVGKTYPTYYIAQLNDVKVPLEGKMIRFTANASQLSAEAGNYELYVEAQTKEVFRQGYFILKRGKVAESTTNSDTQFKTDISVADNLEFETNREIVTAISDAINETTGVYELFGDLIELDNRTILKGELGHDIIIDYGWGNVAMKPIAEVNSKIQFFKDLRDLGQENDDILRTFKIMKYIIDKAAGGDPMAKIFKSYLDVAESMTSAIERISNGYNDATSGMVINEHPIYLKVKKDITGWRSFLNINGGDYFEASEFNMYIAKAEVFSNKSGSQRFTLPIEKDDTDSKRLKIRTDGLQVLQFDTGEKVFLKLTFSNKRKLIIPLNSDFVKYDGQYGAMTFVLGTTTTNATEIPEKIKIIEP